ncbi:hypothetical protein MKX01_004286, partial [Papaver californicum]
MMMTKRNLHFQLGLERKWLILLLTGCSILSLILLLLATFGKSDQKSSVIEPNYVGKSDLISVLKSKPPRLAYLISGTKGDGPRMRRLLQAVYHPWNYYLLHLDIEATDNERIELAKYVKFDLVMRRFDNVKVVGKANVVTYKGPTMIAATLHGVAILLKQGMEWDWFINLSPSDYPLMSQDDILHVFSYLPRDLNFLEHTSNIGWK